MGSADVVVVVVVVVVVTFVVVEDVGETNGSDLDPTLLMTKSVFCVSFSPVGFARLCSSS